MSNPTQTLSCLQDWLTPAPSQPLNFVEASPAVDAVAVQDLVTVKLWQIVGLPLAQVTVKEHCGRVYLTAFIPHQAPDPLLPVALVDLGQAYQSRLGLYVQHLLAWSKHSNQAQWSQQAQVLLYRVYAALGRHSHRLSQAERQYLILKLALAAAQPSQ